MQEDVTWFGERGSPMAEVNVHRHVRAVGKPILLPLLQVPSQLGSTSSPPRAEVVARRGKMWLATRCWAWGPTIFGMCMDLIWDRRTFDDRITANSWHVEMLATTGVIGLMADGC